MRSIGMNRGPCFGEERIEAAWAQAGRVAALVGRWRASANLEALALVISLDHFGMVGEPARSAVVILYRRHCRPIRRRRGWW